MATLTAMQPRPYVFPRAVAEVELVQALPEDLKTFTGYDESSKPIYKLRAGLIYWLQSSITGKVETTPRVLTDDCNPNDIKEWLDFKMIWIANVPSI
ncbi:hypothetical protein [uncultured Polaribacter sp.]|uniref:hypothetical protein n=1 Tax=uncultured Polaribacter sp. TaxID=174711 RepID=UPI00263447C8|nr:hypothetical protein [uncultured Polaribacter sp.]